MADYPDDTEFEDVKIDAVKRAGKSWTIGHGGWGLYCGDDCPVEPKIGQTARMYPGTIGRPVRGLFIDGVRVWYRTEAEEKEHHEIQLYGADAADWLRRWDANQTVWTIEMGGLGPGYEQCIHITAAEVLRWLLEHKPELDEDWDATREAISAHVTKTDAVEPLGAWRMHIRDVAEMSGCTSAAFRRCNRAHAAYFSARDRLDTHDYSTTPEAAAERECRARVWGRKGGDLNA